MVSAIILAAGESVRMAAQNKLLLPFDGKTLVEQVVDNVLASTAGEVLVILGYQAEEMRQALKDRKLLFVENQAFRIGMTTSIRAGVEAAALDADGYMVCLSDQPFVKPEEFTRLIRSFESAIMKSEKRIVVPAFQGRRGNPVIFSSEFKGDILDHKGLKGCKGLVRERPDSVLEVEMTGDHVLMDIDTLEDYETFVANNG